MFAGAIIAVLSAVLFASPAAEEPWHGVLPETPQSLSTLQEGWIETYRERLEKLLYHFTLVYELDPTDEELCRQEVYRLWVAEAQHYSDSFDELARLRTAMEPDAEGHIDPKAQEAYRKAFFGMRDNAPLEENNLIASLEEVLVPGDYSHQRQRLIEVLQLLQQRVFFLTEDRVRMSSSGRAVRSRRRACAARCSESGGPMPHRVWIARQRATREGDSSLSQNRLARREVTESQAECRPGGSAVRRPEGFPRSELRYGEGPPHKVTDSITAYHPVLSEWTELVAEVTRKRAMNRPSQRVHLKAMKDAFQSRLETYVSSRADEYSQVEESTMWDEYRRLHEPLDAPLSAMTQELQLRLGWFADRCRSD